MLPHLAKAPPPWTGSTVLSADRPPPCMLPSISVSFHSPSTNLTELSQATFLKQLISPVLIFAIDVDSDWPCSSPVTGIENSKKSLHSRLPLPFVTVKGSITKTGSHLRFGFCCRPRLIRSFELARLG
jgi:hypothetical protein